MPSRDAAVAPSPRYRKATLVTTTAAAGLVIAFIAAMAALFATGDPDDAFDAPGAAGGLIALLILLAMVTLLAAVILPGSARWLHARGRLRRGAFLRLSAALTAGASLLLVSAFALLVTGALAELALTLIVLTAHLIFMLPLALLWFAVAMRPAHPSPQA